jgi:hypothetical protein
MFENVNLGCKCVHTYVYTYVNTYVYTYVHTYLAVAEEDGVFIGTDVYWYLG